MTPDEKDFAEAHGIDNEHMELFKLIYSREQKFKTAIWILAISTATMLLALILLLK